jgi:hypothetical protein
MLLRAKQITVVYAKLRVGSWYAVSSPPTGSVMGSRVKRRFDSYRGVVQENHFPDWRRLRDWALSAAQELGGVGEVEFVDLVVDFIGREAGGRHAVAHFISFVRVHRGPEGSVNEHTDI